MPTINPKHRLLALVFVLMAEKNYWCHSDALLQLHNVVQFNA
ncbi:MAG: hypothetical protein R3D29_06850 [Nitratireductor sp.]